MPPIIQSDLKFRGNETLENAIKMAHDFLLQIQSTMQKAKELFFSWRKKRNQKPDMIDIDYIGKSEK